MEICDDRGDEHRWRKYMGDSNNADGSACSTTTTTTTTSTITSTTTTTTSTTTSNILLTLYEGVLADLLIGQQPFGDAVRPVPSQVLAPRSELMGVIHK